MTDRAASSNGRARVTRAALARLATAALCFAVAPAPAEVAPMTAAAPATGGLVRHSLVVTLTPATHRLVARDRLSVPAELVTSDFRILLNADLRLRLDSPGLRLLVQPRGTGPGMDRETDSPNGAVRVNAYRIGGAHLGEALILDLDYEGEIDHPIRDVSANDVGALRESPGLIEERGVYLAGSSHWVPEVGQSNVQYRLEVRLPAGWKSVSEGSREPIPGPAGTAGAAAVVPAADWVGSRDIWNPDTPTEQVHLIAARFSEYERVAGTVKTYAFLRTPDADLAARYLAATAQYLEMYQALLGDYPYRKFALVENFWQTGYGMPSFTLLGDEIIRFPFILTSSYPHELLHNWWGNGVFVDVAGGNWCEGLTAYLADHLLAEQRGQGAEHRRDILQRVSDYLTPQNDFPVTEFRSRHDAASEVIGYGKTAMMWNMLRERLGDATFVQGLRRFYAEQRFRSADFDDLRRNFEAVSGQELRPFFRQWLTQTGVPDIRLDSATRTGNTVRVTLSQAQLPRFSLDVPVALYTAQGVMLRKIALPADAAGVSASFDLTASPTRVAVDPQFQVYRRLGVTETPPSLSKAFGAQTALIVAPTGAVAQRYVGLIKAWRRAGVDCVDDDKVDHLPDDRPVWILDGSNRFVAAAAAALRADDARLDASGLRIGETTYPLAVKSIIAVGRNPENASTVRVFISAPTSAAADGLARKLPHYGKYSWLIFNGDAPDNEAKGEWSPTASHLVHDFEPRMAPIPLPVRRALAELPLPR